MEKYPHGPHALIFSSSHNSCNNRDLHPHGPPYPLLQPPPLIITSKPSWCQAIEHQFSPWCAKSDLSPIHLPHCPPTTKQAIQNTTVEFHELLVACKSSLFHLPTHERCWSMKILPSEIGRLWDAFKCLELGQTQSQLCFSVKRRRSEGLMLKRSPAEYLTIGSCGYTHNGDMHFSLRLCWKQNQGLGIRFLGINTNIIF